MQKHAHPLAAAREVAGVSRSRLALLAGLVPSTLYRVEKQGHRPSHSTMQAIIGALEAASGLQFAVSDVFPFVVDPQRAGVAMVWPPEELLSDTYLAVRAYRAAGDSVGAAQLLDVAQDTIRKRLNAAGCLPRPRGGDRADGVRSLAQWARDEQITMLDALADWGRGRVPGAAVEQLEDPILVSRNVVHRK